MNLNPVLQVIANQWWPFDITVSKHKLCLNLGAVTFKICIFKRCLKCNCEMLPFLPWKDVHIVIMIGEFLKSFLSYVAH